jgi:hypothetical protein
MLTVLDYQRRNLRLEQQLAQAKEVAINLSNLCEQLRMEKARLEAELVEAGLKHPVMWLSPAEVERAVSRAVAAERLRILVGVRSLVGLKAEDVKS